MQDKKETPSVIFDWLQHKDFQSLTKHEQTEILEYFSEEEYDEMRFASINIQNQKLEREREGRIKTTLLQRFDQVHPVAHGKMANLFAQFPAWKIAAVLVPFVLLWFVNSLMNDREKFSVTPLASIDTVYVTKTVEADPVVVHDTVYIDSEENQKTKGSRPAQQVVARAEGRAGLNDQDFEVVSASETNSEANAIKGNSLKGDSIFSRFQANSL